MKVIIGTILFLSSYLAAAAEYDCNFVVNGDFVNGRSFHFNGTVRSEVKISPFQASVAIINLGSDEIPDLRLEIKLSKEDDYSASLFNIESGHPFASAKISGDQAQIQCWVDTKKQ